MSTVIPITDFRKNLFQVADQVSATGVPVTITREGKMVLKLVPVKDDVQERTKYVIENVLPKLAGTWTDKDYKGWKEYFHGKKAKRYLSQKRFQW